MTDKYYKYADIPFSAQQWQLLKNAIDKDLDIDKIANEAFSPDQLQVLIKGIEYGVDISVINDAAIPAEQMDMILEHIMSEMGIYEEHYEKVRASWLKNITWAFLLLLGLAIASILFVLNKDTLLSYTDELKLEVQDTVTLEAGSIFYGADYIKEYTETAKLSYPETIELPKPCVQLIEYEIANSVKRKTAKLKLIVVDNTAPNIHLSQDYVSISSPSDFSCRNYLKGAYDLVDGDLSAEVSCSVFDSNARQQEIIYSVSDSSGNKASAFLKVEIEKEKPVIPPPVVTKPNVTTSGRVDVIVNDKTYKFKEGDDFEKVHAQCQSDGKKALNSRQANSFSCKPIMNNEGIYTGYSLTFE